MSEMLVASSATDVAQSSVGYAAIGNMVLGLIFVVILIFGLAFLVKRFKLTSVNQGDIQIKALTSVGTKEKVMLINYGDHQYLIGVTASQITLIDKMPNLAKLEQTFSSHLNDHSSIKTKD